MNVAICYDPFRVNTHLSIQWDIMFRNKKNYEQKQINKQQMQQSAD